MNVRFCIMSSGRPDKQTTLKQFPDAWLPYTDVCVCAHEVKAYKKALSKTNVNVIAPPKEIKGIGPQRQWYMEQTTARFVFMADDDLTFLIRDVDMRLGHQEKVDMVLMVEEFKAELDAHPDVGLIGISSRNGNNRETEDYQEVARAMQFQFVDMDVYRSIGATFNPTGLVLMEDLHIVLVFLEHGYKNRVYYKYAIGSNGSNTNGGCSQYRDGPLQAASARLMQKLHPNSVRVVTKVTTASWSGFEKRGDKIVRTDVNIAWKKAYRPKRTTKGIGMFV